MKLAISATGGSLDSDVDMRFGRCPYFIFVTLENRDIKDHEIVENIGSRQTGGAGISAAELVAKKGVSAILTGNTGPRAFAVFQQFNITVYSASGKIRDAIKDFSDGKLTRMHEASGPRHHNVE